MLDGRVLEASQVQYKPFGKPPLQREPTAPIHDAVLGFEHCVVAKARRILDAPPRYLAQVKTDCLLTQRLPKRFAERLRALEALRHPDGTPVYRVEETKPLLGSRAPRMEAERPNNGGGTGWTTLYATAWRAHLVSKTHCSAQNLGLEAQTGDHWVRLHLCHRTPFPARR